MGTEIVSHVDGTVDILVPPSTDAVVFGELVSREVILLGYSPTVEVVRGRLGGSWVRVSTPETLAQQGRGAHRGR